MKFVLIMTALDLTMSLGGIVTAQDPGAASLATFAVDVTIPVGHACMGGGVAPARRVAEPLQVRGFVLTVPGQQPLVVVSFDWCEIRGSAFDDWRTALAEEAGTVPQRVLVSSTHVHDAPVMDPEAEWLLRETEKSGAWKNLAPPDPKTPIQLASVCWPDFNRICIQRAREAVRLARKSPRRVTHLGLGRAEVEAIASNRRFMLPSGGVSFARGSRSGGDAASAGAAEGDIDPWLRTLSFWDGDTPVCALHSYAVHPMSFYGAGEVSIDFVGLARERRQAEQPDVFQIYATGCAGNVTAGKYNDGTPASRAALTDRLHTAMVEAWTKTRKQPLTAPTFRLSRIPLGARATEDHTEAILRQRLANDPKPFARAHAAMGLAWYDRVKSGHQIELPAIDFGPAQLLLLPAETYVEFQLYAQELRPDSFVMCLGYGECGPGYIPIERAWRENDSNLRDWTWVGPGSEEPLRQAIREALAR
ncbi:MAG: hypothetical protein WCF18_21565 [Chthoniobacteraceae bacterium]